MFLETIYANKFKNEIKILEVSESSYETLFSKGFYEKVLLNPQMVENILRIRTQISCRTNERHQNEFDHDIDNYLEEGEEEYRQAHPRSINELNYQPYYSSKRGTTVKEKEDSSISRNSHHTALDSSEHDRSNLKNLEKELKVFMYLDDKNENDDEGAVPIPDSELDAQNPEESIHVEKKLDFLFNQEAPTPNYFESELIPPISMNTPIIVESPLFFSADTGRI